MADSNELAEAIKASKQAQAEEQEQQTFTLPVVNKTPDVKSVVVYPDRRVEVPRLRLVDTILAEQHFGRPYPDIQAHIQTDSFCIYQALFRHSDPAEHPTEDFDKWYLQVDDIELTIPIPEKPEDDDAVDGAGDDVPLSESPEGNP